MGGRLMAPEQYECKDCGSCWSEKRAKRCINGLSKDIRIVWSPKKGKKNENNIKYKKFKIC